MPNSDRWSSLWEGYEHSIRNMPSDYNAAVPQKWLLAVKDEGDKLQEKAVAWDLINEDVLNRSNIPIQDIPECTARYFKELVQNAHLFEGLPEEVQSWWKLYMDEVS